MIIWIERQAGRYKNERSTHFYDVSAISIVRIYCINWNGNDFVPSGGLFVKTYRFLESFCKSGAFFWQTLGLLEGFSWNSGENGVSKRNQAINYLNCIVYSIIGVTKGDRTKWNAINFREKYASNFDHFDYPDKKDNIFRYCFGLIAIVKSADQKTVSCYRGIYSLNFKLEESMLIKNGPITRKSILWGLLKWSKTETTETREMKMIKTKDQERLNNFLQFKALSMFERKGFLERISYMECQK